MSSETTIITSALFALKKGYNTFFTNNTVDKPNIPNGIDSGNKIFAGLSIFGQAFKAGKGIDETVANGNFSSTVNTLAEKTSPKAVDAVKTAGEMGKFLGNAVNGIIICDAGYNVYKDEDKPKALVEQGLKVGGMFGAEKISKALKLTEKIEKSALPGKLKHMVAAASFVAASAGGALSGESLGETITGRNTTKNSELNGNFATA